MNPASSKEIARAVAEEHGFKLATWEEYHPIVLSVFRWLDDRNYLQIVDGDVSGVSDGGSET